MHGSFETAEHIVPVKNVNKQLHNQTCLLIKKVICLSIFVKNECIIILFTNKNNKELFTDNEKSCIIKIAASV